MNAIDQSSTESLASLRALGLRLRRQLGVTAAKIALTEDHVADTLDRVARVRPRDAERLRARATQARLFAEQERQRAEMYGVPDAGPAA